MRKVIKSDKVAREDWGYVPLNPDPDFDPVKNQKIIDNVIRKNQLNFKRKERERKKLLSERTSAIASFVKYAERKDAKISPQDYFGRKYLAQLRGQKIIDILKNAKKNQEAI